MFLLETGVMPLAVNVCWHPQKWSCYPELSVVHLGLCSVLPTGHQDGNHNLMFLPNEAVPQHACVEVDFTMETL